MVGEESNVGVRTNGIQRLGKRELGRRAFEERMPDRIADLIAVEDDSNNIERVIPRLAKLIGLDEDVETAYLCIPSAVQIHKLPDEGAHFCGYRNMQMLLLTLPLALTKQAESQEHGNVDFSRKVSILALQDFVERAWDAGFNAHGRVQTGGIRSTRKHVGTSEAEALLLSLGTECIGSAFSGKDAHIQLLDSVEIYFSASIPSSSEETVHITARPPIFLQRPNHSLTIVGIERLRSGKRRLLVFDPAWRPPSAVKRGGGDLVGLKAKWVLWQYRKNERWLKKYGRFETLSVD